MRKLFSILTLFLIVTLLCACNSHSDADVHNYDHEHSHDGNTTAAQVTTEGETQASTDTLPEVYTADATGPLSSKHSLKIDVPFETEFSQAKTDEKKTTVCDEYREEWTKVANGYINELINYNGEVPVHPGFSTDKKMHEYIEFRKGDFDSFFESESKSYLAQAEEQYGKGDKANALCAKYKFELQRSFALEMIEVYELLGEFNGQVF